MLSTDALVFAHQRLASGLGMAGKLDEALENCRKAEEYLARVEKQNPGLVQTASRRVDIVATRGDAYWRAKKWKEAIGAYEAADGIFQDLRKRDPKNNGHLSEQAGLRMRLAGSYAGVEEWSDAARWMKMALGVLDELAGRRALRVSEEDQRREGVRMLGEWGGR
jgi:tetratricopeptide (TPR) repeat protein